MKVTGGQAWTQKVTCSSKACKAELEITASDVFYVFALPLDDCYGSYIVFCGACTSPITLSENVLTEGIKSQARQKSKIIRTY